MLPSPFLLRDIGGQSDCMDGQPLHRRPKGVQHQPRQPYSSPQQESYKTRVTY
jgi:hypothetical protein